MDGDGPADKAGLQVGDVVTAIDGQPVTTAEELIVAVRTHRPGDQVTLTYERGGQQSTAEVTLGSREAERERMFDIGHRSSWSWWSSR